MTLSNGVRRTTSRAIGGHELDRRSTAIRVRCNGWPAHEIVAAIMCELPEVLPLEAQRLARGWSRTELSRRIDALYESDGLAPPQVHMREILRWEHGQVVPSEERRDYLCRVYETRPDLLGFGVDYTPKSRSTTVDSTTTVMRFHLSPDSDELRITVDLRALAMEMIRARPNPNDRPVVLHSEADG